MSRFPQTATRYYPAHDTGGRRAEPPVRPDFRDAHGPGGGAVARRRGRRGRAVPVTVVMPVGMQESQARLRRPISRAEFAITGIEESAWRSAPVTE